MNGGLVRIGMVCDGCRSTVYGRTFAAVNANAAARGWVVLFGKHFCGSCTATGVFLLVLGAVLLEGAL